MANSIKEKLSDIHYIWLTELKAIFADQGVMIFFFLVPLIYPLLYAAFYNNEVVRDAKLVFVDEDNSRLSREYIRRIDATPDVEVVKILPTLEEANEMLRRKEAYGVVLISKDFSNPAQANKRHSIQRSFQCALLQRFHGGTERRIADHGTRVDCCRRLRTIGFSYGYKSSPRRKRVCSLL